MNGNHIKAPTAHLGIWVDEREKLACIRIDGRASFTSSADFKVLVNRLFEMGYKQFVLELKECRLMDSTFLGVLAGLGLRICGGQCGDNQAVIALRNASPRILDLLENLGVHHLFRVVQENGSDQKMAPLPAISPSITDPAELARVSLEAHKTLMKVNPANIPRFTDVTKFLAEDLKRLEGNQPPPDGQTLK